MELLQRNSQETATDYLIRLGNSKKECGYTWQEIANRINEEFGQNYSKSFYNKKYIAKTFDEQTYIEKRQEFDLQNESRAIARRVSREETIRNIAHDAVQHMSSQLQLPAPKIIQAKEGNSEAILLLSDWHYGIDIDSYFNHYNIDIAKDRVNKLQNAVISRLKKEGVSRLYVVNLGDLICGRIHLQLRISSQIDTVTQVMQVSEIVAELLNNLSNYVQIEYFDTLDNHSRLEPATEKSLELESLVRITTWYLRERLKDNSNINFNDNTFADDIANFECLGHPVIAVHGHKDPPAKVIDSLSMLTKKHYDIVLSAHYHHFNCDEQTGTVRISNGSLMGTDDYAQNLRVNSEPSQTLIVVTKENPVEGIYKIIL